MSDTATVRRSVVANRTPTRSARVAKKTAVRQVAAKLLKPQKSVVKASARKPMQAAAKVLPAHYAIAKSEGDEAVLAWINLLPAWQTDRAGRVDAIVVREVCDMHEAVKWHGIWLGVPGQGWFLAVATCKARLKLVF